MPLFIESVENDITLGEICNTPRGVWASMWRRGCSCSIARNSFPVLSLNRSRISVNLGHDNQIENQKHRERRIKISAAWLARAGSYRLILDSELDSARCAHTLGFLSSVGGLLSWHGRAGLLAHRHIPAHAQLEKIYRPIPYFCARVVDLRTAQPAHPELDIYRC